MRIAVIILLLLWAAWTVFSPVIRYNEKPTWVVAIIILVPTLIMGGYEARWQFHENQATQVVQEVSGKAEGKAQCQRLSEAFFDTALSVKGMVYYDQDKVAHLKYDTCQSFMSWMESDKSNPSEKEAMAVLVVIHEATHVGGEHDEAITECKADKKLAEVAEKLGATKLQATALYALYMDRVHPYQPSQYQNGVC